ncbi:chemotaxis protein CheW [Pseudoxanthomonas jiangsuensis]|uniref:chemotaxis protein CheW n=1 Tax=Pseudoxanthomonas jiangsuensis TaxID=619688 RepID=UPI001390D078|nr:chemotaxis protein CheW [Pseudoxanthomonas jiangsuensis]KAF1698523.1 chemotaxis protein CheW [Pseudoxanthomonas jiangsuensis]
MAYNKDEIRGVMIQVGQERLLLPNATVAEVMARVPVEPIAGAPDWLAGQIDWHGWTVPLVAFSRLAGLGQEAAARNNRVVVLKGMGGDEAVPYLALQTASFPQLVSVPRDSLLADASEEELPRGVQMRVLLGDLGALLPDLEGVERLVAEALAAAA